MTPTLPADSIQKIQELALAGQAPIIAPADTGAHAPLLIWPAAREIVSLENFGERPLRKRVAVVVHDHNSFIAYVTAHKETGTAVFAVLTEKGGLFLAVLDYHEANREGEPESTRTDPVVRALPGKPRWGEHTCELRMLHTPEWKRWTENNGKNMGQEAFAQFLEDNRVDIVSPNDGEIIDIAKSLEANTGSQFKSAIRLENGDRALHFETQTTARAGTDGALTIPDRIKLRLPVFVNGLEYEIEAFFRYRIENGALKLRYELIRPHKVIELALSETKTAIVQAVNVPVYEGAILQGIS